MAARVVFLGNDPWSALALSAYMGAAAADPPVLVFTRVPRPAGRGSALRPTAVADLARELDLPLLEAETVRTGPGLEAIRAARPDVLAVVAYGEILPRAVLDLPRLGSVNVHFSLLPRWRGASPVQHTILEGDAVAGVTTMLVDEGLDTGPIVEQTQEVVAPDEDAGSLGARLAGSGGILLRRAVEGLAEGSIEPRPQPDEGVTYAPKLPANERRIDWSRDASAIGRRVRAFAPEPGASTTFRGDPVKILRGRPGAGRGEPGAILPVDPGVDPVTVGTGDGVYRILEVAPAGRRRMDAAAWARGARFVPGERLG